MSILEVESPNLGFLGWGFYLYENKFLLYLVTKLILHRLVYIIA